MKVGPIIARALRLIRVLDPDEAPEPGQYEVALTALNAMMGSEKWRRMNLGWIVVDNPDDDFPAPEYSENAITYSLAAELRPEFGATLDPDLEKRMEELFADVNARRMQNTYARLSYDLPEAEGYERTTASDFYSGH